MKKVDRTKGVWIILALGLVMGLVLTVYLYFDSTTVKTKQFTDTLTDKSDYEIQVSIGEKVGDITYITGYFFKYGESIDYYQPQLLLVRNDGMCFEVPTVSVIDKTLNEVYVDDYEYQNSGFEALVNASKIESGEYAIYLHEKLSDVTLDSEQSLEVNHE